MPFAGPGQPLQAYNSECYQDPAFPGSAFKPKYVACRGDSESTLAGQTLTSPRAYMDLNLQYVHRNMTYGVYVTNVFDDYRSEPGVNQDWQPVANGVGGAQTGQYAGTYPYLLQKRKPRTESALSSRRPQRSGVQPVLAPVSRKRTCRGARYEATFNSHSARSRRRTKE